jgi:hypothetical protein
MEKRGKKQSATQLLNEIKRRTRRTFSQIFILLFLCSICLITFSAKGQDTSRNSISISNQNEGGVTITTIGGGKNIEEAKMSALRSALEQVSGSYLSSSTKISNDKIIADNITTITNGTIKSYEIINEKQTAEGYSLLIKSTILINKLADFVSEKSGDKIEIKGGLFVANIKQLDLNASAEIIAIKELSEIYSDMLFKSYSFRLKAEQPRESKKSNNFEERVFEIPINVTMYYNSNITIANEFLLSSLRKISLPHDEVNLKNFIYGADSRQAFRMLINSDTFYFRNKLSPQTILYYDKEKTNTDYKFAFYIDDGVDKFNRYINKDKASPKAWTSFVRDSQEFKNFGDWCELITYGYNIELCNNPCSYKDQSDFSSCKYNYVFTSDCYWCMDSLGPALPPGNKIILFLPTENKIDYFRLNAYYKLSELEKIKDIKIIKKDSPKIK